MFYHPTKCPDCTHKNPFGKVRCVKCYKRLYTDDLKPLPTSEGFPPTIHSPQARHDRYTRKLSVLKARQPTLSRISSLTSMGTFLFDISIAMTKEFRQIGKDLSYVWKVIFNPPPNDTDDE